MVCVDAFTGAIEGRVQGETYMVSPRIRIAQPKIPATFVKSMDGSNDAIQVAGYMS